jgi:hypothetical protein
VPVLGSRNLSAAGGSSCAGSASQGNFSDEQLQSSVLTRSSKIAKIAMEQRNDPIFRQVAVGLHHRSAKATFPKLDRQTKFETLKKLSDSIL